MNVSKSIQDKSHSGAELKVIKKNEFIVKKTIFSDIERAQTAYVKQRKFKQLSTQGYLVKAIPINSISSLSDGLVAEMPYIEGVTGEHFAIHGSKKLANKLKDTLNSYLTDCWANSLTSRVSKDNLILKVNSIESKPVAKNIANSVKICCQYIRDKCPEYLNIPVGNCHGDLTLSNMIISQGGELYLFDFLDVFLESPLQDVCKLLQDFRYGWSFRKAKQSIRLKSQIFCQAAFPDVITSISNIYKLEVKVFEILTILRVAPYIQENDMPTQIWFNNTVDKFIGENK